MNKKNKIQLLLILLVITSTVVLAGVDRTISGECPVGSTKNMISVILTKSGTVTYYSVSEKIPNQVSGTDIIFRSSDEFGTVVYPTYKAYERAGMPNSKTNNIYELDIAPSSTFTIAGSYVFDTLGQQTTTGDTTVTTRSLTCTSGTYDDPDGDGYGPGCLCPDILDCDDDYSDDTGICPPNPASCTTGDVGCAICRNVDNNWVLDEDEDNYYTLSGNCPTDSRVQSLPEKWFNTPKNPGDCDDDKSDDPNGVTCPTSAAACTGNQDYSGCAFCIFPTASEGDNCIFGGQDDCWGENDDIDQDCDNYDFKDTDNDNFVDAATGIPFNYGKDGVRGTDCCDDNAGPGLGCDIGTPSQINPNINEGDDCSPLNLQACGNNAGENDGIDNDCNNCDFVDLDDDGYRKQGTGCGADDCNDANANIHPADESFDTWCNGEDENCDGHDCCRTTNYPLNDPLHYDGWPGNSVNPGDVEVCNSLDDYEKDVFIKLWLNSTFEASLDIIMANIPSDYQNPK